MVQSVRTCQNMMLESVQDTLGVLFWPHLSSSNFWRWSCREFTETLVGGFVESLLPVFKMYWERKYCVSCDVSQYLYLQHPPILPLEYQSSAPFPSLLHSLAEQSPATVSRIWPCQPCQVRLCYVRGLGPQNHAAFAVCDLQGGSAHGLPPMVERQDAWHSTGVISGPRRPYWDVGKIPVWSFLILFVHSAYCSVHVCWFMSVGFCLNLVDLVYLELVTGVKQYNRSSGSKYVTLRTQAHPNALARSQWEVVKFSCKIPVHHMPHFSNLRPAVLVIEDESSAERSRIKGNGSAWSISRTLYDFHVMQFVPMVQAHLGNSMSSSAVSGKTC